LKETVAVGARWYHESDNKISIVPDLGAENVQLFEPGKDRQVISVVARAQDDPVGEVNSFTVRQASENRWLAARQRTTALFPFRYPMEPTEETIRRLIETELKDVKWKNVPTIEFEINCTVSVPLKSSGKVLLLVEFPGRNPYPSSCECLVDDSMIKLEEKSSDEHIGYFVPNGDLHAYESEWHWYICPVPDGSHTINFRGKAGHPNPRFRVWLWADSDLTDRKQMVSVQCSDPVMPQYLDKIERHGIRLVLPESMIG
jgi:hypothetical protein